jgi:hypothetical protein
MNRCLPQRMAEYQVVGHGLVIPRGQQAGVPRHARDVPAVCPRAALPVGRREIADNARPRGHNHVCARTAVDDHEVPAGIHEIPRPARLDRSRDLRRGQPAVTVDGDRRRSHPHSTRGQRFLGSY